MKICHMVRGGGYYRGRGEHVFGGIYIAVAIISLRILYEFVEKHKFSIDFYSGFVVKFPPTAEIPWIICENTGFGSTLLRTKKGGAEAPPFSDYAN